MANINNLRVGDGYPDSLMLDTYLKPEHYTNQDLTFTTLVPKDNTKVWASVLGEWQVNDDWEIEILSPKKVAIKKFRIDTWGLRKIWGKGNSADTDPLGYSDLIQLRLKVSGLSYVHNNIVYQEDSEGNKTYGFTPAYCGTGGYNVYWYPGQYTSGRYIRGLGVQSSIGYQANQNEIDDSFQMGKHPWDVGNRNAYTDGTYTGTWSDGSYRATSIGLFGGYQTATEWHEYTGEDYTGTAYKVYDISETPIIIDIAVPKSASSIYVSPHTAEAWDSYLGDTKVYHKDKTVENCLKKYYSGTSKTITTSTGTLVGANGTITILKESGNKYTLPDPKEIIDLYPDGETPDVSIWNLSNLRLETTSDSTSSAYVEWINAYLESLENNTIEYSSQYNYLAWPGYYGLLAGLWIENTEENPIILRLNQKAYNTTTGVTHRPDVTFDRLLCDFSSEYTLGRTTSKIGFLRIEDPNELVPVLQRGFRGFTGTIDIVYTMSPHTLDDTFTGTNITGIPVRNGSGGEITGYVDNEVPAHWFKWSALDWIQYAFENSAITAIRCYEDDNEMGIGDRYGLRNPNTSSTVTDEFGNDNQYFRWPSYKNRSAVMDDSDTQTSWSYSYVSHQSPRNYTQAFNTASLEIIEPIIPCKYLVTSSQTYIMLKSGLTSIKLNGLNNFSWDFCDTAPNYLNCPNLDAESIAYMINNAEDQIAKPYDSTYAPDWNVHNGYTGEIRYDYVNIRSSESVDGLYINCHPGWLGIPTITGYSAGSGTTISKNIMKTSKRNAGATIGSSQGTDIASRQWGSMSNIIFRISGLVSGDTLRVGDDNSTKIFYNIEENGIYRLDQFTAGSVLTVSKRLDDGTWESLEIADSSLSGVSNYMAWGLIGDTTITSEVTIEFLGNKNGSTVYYGTTMHEPYVTPELVETANSKGWTIKVNGTTVTPETITDYYYN